MGNLQNNRVRVSKDHLISSWLKLSQRPSTPTCITTLITTPSTLHISPSVELTWTTWPLTLITTSESNRPRQLHMHCVVQNLRLNSTTIVTSQVMPPALWQTTVIVHPRLSPAARTSAIFSATPVTFWIIVLWRYNL